MKTQQDELSRWEKERAQQRDAQLEVSHSSIALAIAESVELEEV